MSLRSRATAALAAIVALPATAAAAPVSATAAEAEPPAPYCDRSLQSHPMLRAGGRLTVSPEPGTVDATPQTQISILGVPADQLSRVTVTGSRSGHHKGQLEPYSQGDGASFVLSRPLQEGERVTVKLMLQEGSDHRQVGWRFAVDYKAGLGAAFQKHHNQRARQARRRRWQQRHKAHSARRHGHHGTRHGGAHTARIASAGPGGQQGPSEASSAPEEAEGAQHFISEPELQPPALEITVPTEHPQPGYLFMSPFTIGQAGPMIFDDQGQLIWFHPVNVGPTAATKATNFQLQSYEGKPVLTWWEDPLREAGQSRRKPEDLIYNSSYEQVAAVEAGNGLVPDVHEFRITPQGTALIAVKHDIRCNLSGVHGTADGSVWDGVIQEVDIKTGLVRWEWNSLDHVSLQEAYDSAKFASASYPFDFFHLNSIQALGPHRLFASARNTWAMYNIDRRTGEIHWRLGGKHSSFTMLAGTRTAWQHDARVIGRPGKHRLLISVFDNGSTPKVHHQSRGLMEVVSFHNHTARLKRQLTNSPPVLAGSQGSVELLSNGYTVVGWGQEPWVTEFSPSGQITFDAHFPKLEQSYRALRYEWQGTPSSPPSVAVQAAGSGRLAVYASWNGATDVASWRVLEGPSEGALSAIATAPRNGFETQIFVPSGGAVLQVQALNAGGEVIGSSALQHA